MIPLRIRGANCKVSGANLPSLTAYHHKNVYYTAWEPTPKEVELLSNGGKVVLACAGVQPYVVIKAIETDLEMEDYFTPYPIKEDSSAPDWELKEIKKKRGRPRKNLKVD